MSLTIEVLVSFRTSTRKVTLEAGSTLESLKKEFMVVFSDILPNDADSSDYLFKKYDSLYEEYVDAKEDKEISNGDKFIVEDSPLGNAFITPHKIKGDATYHIWSQVSQKNDSLMKRNNTTIKCNGSEKSGDSTYVNITAKDVSSSTEKLYRFELDDPKHSSKCYVITGKGENENVYVQEVDASSTPPKDNESKFEPKYYFSFTRFRCFSINGETDLYLASDKTGKTTLVRGEDDKYPNASTLFICSSV